MKRSHAHQPARYGLVLSLLMAVGAPAGAEEPSTSPTPSAPSSPRDVLSPAQWRNVDRSIHRGLDYLAAHQREDGSFEAPPTGQPGVTALCVLAFLSRGHLPGEGPYGERINRAIDFVLTCQREDGMFSFIEPEPHHVHDGASHAGNYNHAIAGLMLGEVYGMTNPQLRERIKTAIPAGLQFLRRMQEKAKASPLDHGGWRYIRPRQGIDADLSATSWQLMSMRSARNAEFHVPKEWIEEAMAYIRRCFNNNRQTFSYTPHRSFNLITPGIVGGGIVSLSLGGEHNTEIAQLAGKSVLRYSFARYNTASFPYHYGAYYCSQAMYQLGGEYWTKFYPQLSKHLLANQRADGSWERENFNNGDYFGRSYTTSLSVLALTPAYQLLPIYQR